MLLVSAQGGSVACFSTGRECCLFQHREGVLLVSAQGGSVACFSTGRECCLFQHREGVLLVCLEMSVCDQCTPELVEGGLDFFKDYIALACCNVLHGVVVVGPAQ